MLPCNSMGTNKNYRTHRHGYKANTGNNINYLPPVMPRADRKLSPLHRAELIEESSLPPILNPDYYTEFDYWHLLKRDLTDPMDGTEAKRAWEEANADLHTELTSNPPWMVAYKEAAEKVFA